MLKVDKMYVKQFLGSKQKILEDYSKIQNFSEWKVK